MNTADLKIDIINRITNLNDIRIIEEIQKILDFELDNWIFQLNDAQWNRILDAESDQTMTEQQANKEIEEWLQGK